MFQTLRGQDKKVKGDQRARLEEVRALLAEVAGAAKAEATQKRKAQQAKKQVRWTR
jgi:hypothetical protein